MDNVSLTGLLLIGFVAFTVSCKWESVEGKNIVGHILVQYENISTQQCKERCEQSALCKSIDYGVEDGVSLCQLNSVTRDDASLYVTVPGVTHYYCDSPAESKSGDSWERFKSWVKDNPEYFTLIIGGVAIAMLVTCIMCVLYHCVPNRSRSLGADGSYVETGTLARSFIFFGEPKTIRSEEKSKLSTSMSPQSAHTYSNTDVMEENSIHQDKDIEGFSLTEINSLNKIYPQRNDNSSGTWIDMDYFVLTA